jgi:hypothetical protein
MIVSPNKCINTPSTTLNNGPANYTCKQAKEKNTLEYDNLCVQRNYNQFVLKHESDITFLKNIHQGENTLKVNHFSPKKVMYNEYYNM